MATDTTTTTRPGQPIERVQRRPTDALWFAVLFASVATGIGMTIFAPTGNDAPAVAPALMPPVLDPATSPATSASQSATSPSTAPIP